MTDCRRAFPLALFCLLAVPAGLLLPGCPMGAGSQGGKVSADRTLLEPFTPPSLAELDAKAEWEDQRVIEIMEEFRKWKGTQPALVTVPEALAMKNNSNEDNEKILSALGKPWEKEADANFDAEINRHIPADISSTNPLLGHTHYDNEVIGMTGMGFFGFDWDMIPYAPKEYVISWQTSKDKLFDKVVIRDDLYWSDGKKVTAHDVEYSFRTIMDPDVRIPAQRTGMDKVRWVHAYDDRTFVIFHRESLATNVWNLNFSIIPKHIYEKTIPKDKTMGESVAHLNLEDKPVVAGAYQVAKRTKGQEIILERREGWYMVDGKQVRPKPHFKRIRFKVIQDPNTARLALMNGQIADYEMQPDQWSKQTNGDDFYKFNTKVRGEQWVYYYFGWNIDTPYFSDVRVRKAMSYTVDYNYILNTLCYGLYPQCTSEFHPDSWTGPLTPRTPYVQDLAKAEQLLTEAGWTDTDGDGVRDKMVNGQKLKFEFELMCSDQPLRIDICSSLKENLSRIGVACNVKPTEFTVMSEKSEKREFQGMFGGWGTGTDPFTTENLWKTKQERNYTNYSNPRVDELFDKARVSLVQAERAKYYREIDDILWEDQPYTWMYYRAGFYAFNKSLRGYTFSPRGPTGYGPGFDAWWPVAQ